MTCPGCGNFVSSKVIDSRALENHDAKRRRRECKCGERWNTIEIPLTTKESNKVESYGVIYLMAMGDIEKENAKLKLKLLQTRKQITELLCQMGGEE